MEVFDNFNDSDITTVTINSYTMSMIFDRFSFYKDDDGVVIQDGLTVYNLRHIDDYMILAFILRAYSEASSKAYINIDDMSSIPEDLDISEQVDELTKIGILVGNASPVERPKIIKIIPKGGMIPFLNRVKEDPDYVRDIDSVYAEDEVEAANLEVTLTYRFNNISMLNRISEVEMSYDLVNAIVDEYSSIAEDEEVTYDSVKKNIKNVLDFQEVKYFLEEVSNGIINNFASKEFILKTKLFKELSSSIEEDEDIYFIFVPSNSNKYERYPVLIDKVLDVLVMITVRFPDVSIVFNPRDFNEIRFIDKMCKSFDLSIFEAKTRLAKNLELDKYMYEEDEESGQLRKVINSFLTMGNNLCWVGFLENINRDIKIQEIDFEFVCNKIKKNQKSGMSSIVNPYVIDLSPTVSNSMSEYTIDENTSINDFMDISEAYEMYPELFNNVNIMGKEITGWSIQDILFNGDSESEEYKKKLKSYNCYCFWSCICRILEQLSCAKDKPFSRYVYIRDIMFRENNGKLYICLYEDNTKYDMILTDFDSCFKTTKDDFNISGIYVVDDSTNGDIVSRAKSVVMEKYPELFEESVWDGNQTKKVSLDTSIIGNLFNDCTEGDSTYFDENRNKYIYSYLYHSCKDVSSKVMKIEGDFSPLTVMEYEMADWFNSDIYECRDEIAKIISPFSARLSPIVNIFGGPILTLSDSDKYSIYHTERNENVISLSYKHLSTFEGGSKNGGK